MKPLLFRVISGLCLAILVLIGGSVGLRSSAAPVPADSKMKTKVITNSIGMKLVLLPKGTFSMGSPPTESSRDEDESQHQVTISRDYFLGAFEVTQSQYVKVMGSHQSWNKGDDLPVENVAWGDAVEFCKKLSELPDEKKARRVYRLPTEAEWEYGCRAGKQSAFAYGDAIEKFGEFEWFGANSDNQSHPVGKKKPNSWGLHDMHGNVYEWCQDWYGEYPKGPTTDPKGPNEGSERVIRGGCWCFEPLGCRSARRQKMKPLQGSPVRSGYGSAFGFRVAMFPSDK